ncbi:MAG: threonine/serine exporter family protein, partial [Muribaculaceae bacterium]|nr:threonine/serine exporter family protein [Muribaculaceae bacterium]
MDTLILSVLKDAFFAALAAVGFAAISNPPKSAFVWFALIAGAGHATRWVMINCFEWNLVWASLAGAFLIGRLAVIIAQRARLPTETFSFPSLLPMITGVNGYKCIQAIVMLVVTKEEHAFDHYC